MKDNLRRSVRDFVQRWTLALVMLLVVLVAGGIRVHQANTIRTACTECNQYGVWDWEYWWLACFEPMPPDCGIGG